MKINNYMEMRAAISSQQNVMGVYAIKNKTSNKRYIGSSKNISNRIRQHREKLKNNKYTGVFQNEYTLYGEENFFVEILEIVTEWNGVMGDRENVYMRLFDTIENGYNKCLNGPICDNVSMSTSVPRNIYDIIEKDIESKNTPKSEWLKEAILEKIVKEKLI